MKSQLEVIQQLIKIKNHKAYISELEVPEEEAVEIANCKCILYNNDNKTLSLDIENFDFIFFTKIKKDVEVFRKCAESLWKFNFRKVHDRRSKTFRCWFSS